MDEEYVEVEEENNSLKAKIAKFLDSRYFIATILVLIAIISFCLGRVSGMESKRVPIKVTSESLGEVKGVSTVASSTSVSGEPAATTVVASKNGTKYHYPWCAGAKQISDKNKITFNSIEEARAAGYTPASNCKGLK